MNKIELIEKIKNDDDFINLLKYNNSLKNLLSEHPTGVSDSVICKALCISQAELDEALRSAIMKFKESVGITDDEI
jgi:hypothetical protein